jgi:hypothetical protein
MNLTKAESMSKMAEYQKRRAIYKHCLVQITGDHTNQGEAYYLCDNKHYTVDQAQKDGLKEYGHDDFIIAEFIEEKCVAVHILGNRHDNSSEDFGEYVYGINKEYGL